MEKEKLECIYVWLSNINGMSYILYIRLLKIFNDVLNLYEISNNKNKFREILIRNNVILSENLISDLTNFNLKEKSVKIYNNLKNQKINIIPIENKKYNQKILHMYNPPLCIFVYGNISKLNKKCIYLHKEEFESYGKFVYEKIYSYLLENKINIYNQNIYIKYENIFDDHYTLKEDLKLNQCINQLYILTPVKNLEYTKEILVTICDTCIIPQAKYDEKKYLKNLVDIFLEQSKNILVVPGKIYNKSSYFSNYLIKEGADILLNLHDIEKYI